VIREVILQMANETGCGYSRILAELQNLRIGNPAVAKRPLGSVQATTSSRHSAKSHDRKTSNSLWQSIGTGRQPTFLIWDESENDPNQQQSQSDRFALPWR
jgi:hypothetical protein